MVKRKGNATQQAPAHTKLINIDDLVLKAESIQSGPDVYANHARLVMTINELIMDLYQISPTKNSPGTPEAVHIQRVIMPLSIAKGIKKAIDETIKGFEKEIGILPYHQTINSDQSKEVQS
jgi:hypothetical protein